VGATIISDLAFSVPTAIAHGTVSSSNPAKIGLGEIGSTSGKNLPSSTVLSPKSCLTFRKEKSLYALFQSGCEITHLDNSDVQNSTSKILSISTLTTQFFKIRNGDGGTRTHTNGFKSL
jgi:hypothetical protein